MIWRLSGHVREALRHRARRAGTDHSDDEGDGDTGPPLGRRAKAANGKGKDKDKAAASAKLTAPAVK